LVPFSFSCCHRLERPRGSVACSSDSVTVTGSIAGRSSVCVSRLRSCCECSYSTYRSHLACHVETVWNERLIWITLVSVLPDILSPKPFNVLSFKCNSVEEWRRLHNEELFGWSDQEDWDGQGM
jgi:hypothetical protein